MMTHLSTFRRSSLVLACLAALAASSARANSSGFDLSIGKQKLVQEIDCSQPNKDLIFIEYPAGASRVETLLDTACRVLPNDQGDMKFFAYRVGEAMGLKPGATYRLSVEYPEDRSRTVYVLNWGCEEAMGFATGQATGDVLKGKYVPNNPESLKYPLSGKMQTWDQFFVLHDRFPEIKRPRGLGTRPLTPEDGFWVIIAQVPPFNDPLSAGAAISKIRLYEVQDTDALTLKLNLPPEGLPRRHVFSREEMSDGAVAFGHEPAQQDPSQRGVKEIADWHEYKMRVMKFLGVNTYCKDLLEFGHNQGWDSGPGGGNDWVNQSSTPKLWEQILDRAAKHDLSVLPYYEYRGSIGQNKQVALGSQHRARRLDGGETYTHISWCEGNNVDIVDPDTIADAIKMLDVSALRYKDKVEFVGAWFRQRPTAMPASFNEKDFRLFASEQNNGNRITRSHLQNDPAMLQKYYAWWFGKRCAFFEALGSHLKKELGDQAFMLYTNDSSEPGRNLPRSITGEGKPNGWEWMQVVVNDDFDAWDKLLSGDEKYKFTKSYDLKDVVEKDMHLRGLKTWAENWDKWENNHSTPPDDPATYADSNAVMLSYTYNRQYTVGSSGPFDAYRTRAGLSIVRHYSLNENEMGEGNGELTGYFVCDVERAGPYSMMADAWAMAHGDPTLLGSLRGNTSNRGFPGYVRNFHAAFLALPALPSKVLEGASSDPEVVVRQISTEKHGTYYSVVNIGFGRKEDVTITLPSAANLTDAATGQPVIAENSTVKLSFYPAQLRALHAK